MYDFSAKVAIFSEMKKGMFPFWISGCGSEVG